MLIGLENVTQLSLKRFDFRQIEEVQVVNQTKISIQARYDVLKEPRLTSKQLKIFQFG